MGSSVNPRRAFTLIELLVVIAIIAVLAGLLFPVFARTREAARATTCRSNLRHIGAAILMYTENYDEMLPRSWFGVDNSGSNAAINYKWMDAILPYVKNEAVFNCPSQGFPPGGRYRSRDDRNYGSYAWNSAYWADPTATPPYNVSLAAVTVPADTLLVGDGNGIQHEIEWPNRSVTPVLTSTRPRTLAGLGSTALVERHNERCCILFCDGHVKAFRLDSLAQQNPQGILHRFTIEED